MTPRLSRSLALVLLAAAVVPTQAQLYYGPTGNGQLTGAWDVGTTADWSTSIGGAATTWANGNGAIFGGTAGTVTIATGGVSATGLTFNVGGYTIAGAALTLTGASTIAANAGTTTISAPVTEAGGLTVSGGNTLVLSGGSGNLGGAISVTGGSTLQIGATTVNGADTYHAATTVAAGSTLVFDGTNSTNLGSGTLSGAGNLTIGTGSSSFTTGFLGLNLTNTITGLTTVSIAGGSAWPSSEIFINSAGSLSANSVLQMTSGRIDLRSSPTIAGLSGAAGTLVSSDGSTGGTFTLTDNVKSGSYTYAGQIANVAPGSGAGTPLVALTKAGAGTQVLSGANTYTGGTIINGGTLSVLSSGSLAASSTLGFGGAGGTFLYDGTGNTGANAALSLGALTFGAGVTGTVQSTLGSATTQTLTFASESRTAGGLGNFVVSGTGNKIVLTGKSGFLDQGTFFNLGQSGATYAFYDTTLGSVRGFNYATDAGGSTVAGGADIGVTTSASHVDVTGAITAQGTATVGTVQIDGANNLTQTGGTTLTTTGILKAGNNASSVSGGTLDTGSTADLVLAANQSSDVLTVASVISSSGGGGLTEGGSGTVILTGTNTYTGNTSVAGTLQIGNGTSGSLASGYAGNFVVGGNGNLNLDLAAPSTTYSGTITGAGAVTQMANTAILSGTITGFTGTYAVGTGATLQLGSTTSAAQQLNNFNNSVTIASGGNLIFDGNSNQTAFGTYSGAGNLTIGTGASSSSSAYFGLSSASNTITGVTTVNIAGGAAWPFSEVFINTTTALSATSVLNMQSGRIDIRANNSVAGLTGTNSATLISADSNGGVYTLTENTATGQSYSYSGAIANTVAGATGTTTLGLTKNGSGTQVLAGANTYTGITSVANGTLLINKGGNAGTGAITSTAANTVVAGANSSNIATLGGNGTIAGATINAFGRLSPGDVNDAFGTTNKLTLISSSSVTMNANSTASFLINGATAGTLYSQLDFTGTSGFVLNGSVNLQLALNYTPLLNSTFLLTSGSSSTTGTTGVFSQLNGVTTTLTEGSTFLLGGNTFSISYLGGSGHDLLLTATAVPEPSTVLLFGLGCALVLFKGSQRRLRRGA